MYRSRWREAAVVFLPLIGLCVNGYAQPVPAGAVPAPANKSQDPFNRESPQSSVFSFLEACHSRDYTRASKYLDLRKLPWGQRLNQGRQLSQELEEILDRDAQFDVADLSRQPEGGQEGSSPNQERVDTFKLNGRTLELDLERITLRSGTSIWLFSAASVELIPEIAQLGSDSPIERHLPALLVRYKPMDTPLWRWIALALLAAALTIFSRLLSRFTLFLIKPLLGRIAPRLNANAFDVFVGPLRTLLSAAGFRAGMASIQPSALLRLYLERGLALVFLLGLAWLGAEIVDLSIRRLRVVLEARRQTFAYSVLPLTSRIIKLAILLAAILSILSDWGYPTTTIVAGLGVGGLAIALAAQKTIENLFGGVAVISDRPVIVGDFCRFGNQTGTVEDIGLRSTRIRTTDRTLVTIPNGQFSSMTLENFNRRDKMLLHFTLNLRRDTTPDQVRTLLASITAILAGNKKVETGAVPVRFIGVGTYSLDVEVFSYILTLDGDEYMRIQQDLLLRILDAVEAAGTALALPTQANITYLAQNGRIASPPRVGTER